MSNSFQSWNELLVHLETKKYKISEALKSSITELKNDAMPITLQNVSENSISLVYLGSINANQFWQTLPEIGNFTQSLKISTHLSIINNPVITIKDFQTTKPSFYIKIPHVLQEEVRSLLNSIEELSNLTSKLLVAPANIELQISQNEIIFIHLGEMNISSIINQVVAKQGIGSSQQILRILNSSLLIRDDVSLVLSNLGISLKYANNCQLNLDEFFSFDSSVSYMNTALNSIIYQIFGKSEVTLSTPELCLFNNLHAPEISFKGLLNSQDFLLKFSERITLNYQLHAELDFSRLTSRIPIIEDLKLIDSELIITNLGYSFTHPKLGRINLSKGVNLIGDINFANLDTNFGNFIHTKLGIGLLKVYISFEPAGLISLKGNIPGNILLFSIEKFNATFSNMLIGLYLGADLKPSFGLTGNLNLQGYDPTQNQEPTLFLSGELSLEPKSLTAFFSQQGENSWLNPYGLVGTELRNIAFQGGGTYLPPYFDNFGFIGDLKWGEIDLNVAFLIDTNDPEKLALVLTNNQAVSLVDLWEGPIAGFIFKQANYPTDLFSKALGFLNTFLDLSIESLRDENGKLNHLIKFVPFPTTIAGQPISEGLEINGKITAWGHTATLSLHGDITFSNIEGSLKVHEIDLGFLKIRGTNDDSLDLALKVTPSKQYLMGDGYVEILNNQIANVEFQITPTNAIFENFDLNLANLLTIDVNTLSIDLESGSGNGSGTISILGNTLAGCTFDVTRNTVTLKNTKLSLVGFLTVDIPTFTVNLTNKSATGTAKITAFNQSLGSGTLSFNTQKVTINNASLSLGDVIRLNVPNLNLDSMNKKVFGLSDLTLLGKQFTSLGISLNKSGFQATSNFNFGILAFNGATLTLNTGTNGNINNSASIAGNLKFIGYNFANIIASVNSSKLTASGSFNFGGILMLKGANSKKNATITLKKANNGLYSSVSIAGSFYLLGKELTSVTVSANSGTLKVLGIKIIKNPERRKSVRL